MNTENTSAPLVAPTHKGQTPWGVIIAILLILFIVVFGAYYAFMQRTAPQPVPSVDTAASISY